MKRILGILAVAFLAAMVLGAHAEDEDSAAANDLAAWNLVGTLTSPSVLTLENVGTAPKDFGGAKVLVGEEVVGALPYTLVLSPNPYTVTQGDMGLGQWKRDISLTRALVAGEKWSVTNGVGTYAVGVA